MALQFATTGCIDDRVKVRLAFVDAPETGQDFGSRAKQAASELAFGKDVTIREMNEDRYKQTVAEVILPDGRSLGRELTDQGLAWWYRHYAPADAEMARLETAARTTRRGLWSQPNPVPPWDWRKGKGVPVTTEVIGNRKRQPQESRLPRTALPGGGGHEIGEPGRIQDGGRGGRDGLSTSQGL